jgi:hypothetical protein
VFLHVLGSAVALYRYMKIDNGRDVHDILDDCDVSYVLDDCNVLYTCDICEGIEDGCSLCCFNDVRDDHHILYYLYIYISMYLLDI